MFRRTPVRDRRRHALLAALLSCVACEPSGSFRRRVARDDEVSPFDAGVIVPDGGFQPPIDRDPSIELSPPVDLGTTECAWLRLTRVERRHIGAPPSAPPLRPRLFGRDEWGRFYPLYEVLRCELRAMNFVPKPLGEGLAMILLRGPEVFSPDDDCDWREPTRTERTMQGRIVWVQERCRRGGTRTERTLRVDIAADYSRVTVRAP